MTDNKYGRLFTRDDVEKIVNLVRKFDEESGSRVDLDLVISDNAFTFPADEPLFVIRAKDQLGLAQVRNYGTLCRARGCKAAHLDGIDRAERDFEAFRREHSDRMKKPD
jgi:hypothetical protein